MKKMRFLLITFILTLSNAIYSQNYLDSNPEWTELISSCFFLECTFEEYTIRLDGNTVINNITYYKTKKEGLIRVENLGTIISETPIEEYLDPIREEQGRFYIYNSTTNQDELLHNFNLQMGSVGASSSSCNSNPQIVTSVDSISNGTEIRKKFTFSNEPFAPSLYEGIGSDKGLFTQPCAGTQAIESGSKILCYSNDNGTFVIDSFFSDCTLLITSLDTETEIRSNFEVYPTPFSEKIFIKNKSENSFPVKIKVVNLHGKTILSNQFLNTETLIELPTHQLTSGMYILIIETEGKFYSSKIMKL